MTESVEFGIRPEIPWRLRVRNDVIDANDGHDRQGADDGKRDDDELGRHSALESSRESVGLHPGTVI